MLYLLDANVLITADNTYYPMDQVPEFWDWMRYQAEKGRIKIPLEVMDEVLGGRPDGLLREWVKNPEVQAALVLEEGVDAALLRRVVNDGYARDLADDEIEEIGRDPFLIAYALGGEGRCVVTTEVSKPTTKRQNRRIPDVCATLAVQCCGPFQMNRELGFRTAWKPS